jgi:hypothetical protein
MALAVESAHRVLDEGSNVFDEVTHIRIHLCGFADPPMALKRVVDLSNEAGNTPRSQWSRIEADLRGAFANLLMGQQTQPSRMAGNTEVISKYPYCRPTGNNSREVCRSRLILTWDPVHAQ